MRTVVVAAVAAGLLFGCAAPQADPPTNVILVSIDTLRADRLGCYGYGRETSPHIDRLAADGVLFERFYHNGGYTLESHLTMMTSLRPHAHNVSPYNGRRLDSFRVTLAEHLRAQGRATAAFVDGGWLRGRLGFEQGFDLYDDSGGRFQTILPKAFDWLDRHGDRPFFLFLHTYDTHSEWKQLPYECPDEGELRFAAPAPGFDGCRDGRCASELLLWANAEIRAGRSSMEQLFSAEEIQYISDLYDGCVHYVDSGIGRLVHKLQSMGLYESSLVVMTSDHGEEFNDHGLMLHGQYGHDEMARLPLILKLPQSRYRGRRVPQLAAMIDLLPTVLEVADVPVDAQAQGRSLMPAVSEGLEVRESVLICANIATTRWKFFGDRQELFDLEQDPGEQLNLYSEQEEILKQLRRQLNLALTEDIRLQPKTRDEVVLNTEERSQLEQLGYLQPGTADGR